MMKWILMATLAAAPIWAQNETVHRIVPLKFADPHAAQGLLRNFGVSIQPNREMKVVALSGPKSAVETAESALKQIDVPGAGQKDVELTVYFVNGRDDAAVGGAAIPQDLQSTVAALKQTFPYAHYVLLDALSLRSRAGSRASTTGQIGNNRLTHFAVSAVNLEGDSGLIRIDGLQAAVRQLQNVGQGNAQYVDVSGVKTDVVDVKEGQKLVVGRASDGPGKALFLVLIAKVAQ